MRMRVGYNSIVNLPLVSPVLVATQVRTRPFFPVLSSQKYETQGQQPEG